METYQLVLLMLNTVCACIALGVLSWPGLNPLNRVLYTILFTINALAVVVRFATLIVA